MSPSPLSMTAALRCGVVIPTYNRAGLTGACLSALLMDPPATCSWRIVVVDDGSTDRTAEVLAQLHPSVELIELDGNRGFSRACNAGAETLADCDYLVFLNNDTLPTAGWLDALVAEAETSDDIGAVGAKLLFPNGQVQHAGIVIGQDGWPHNLYAGFPGDHAAVNRPKDLAAVTAACLLIRQREFGGLGGFDPSYHNGYEDIDLCLRLRERGRRVRYTPQSVVYHLESVTRWPTGAVEGTAHSERVYRERWQARAKPDDLEQYLADGVLELSYGPYYPHTLSVSPHLAVVRRDHEEPAGLERLLALRSRQVMELSNLETRAQLRVWSSSMTTLGFGPIHRSDPIRSELVATGSRHQLGTADRKPLISLLIPVKDGADDLRELLPRVMTQEVSAELEIVAVDSGSSDDTVEVLRRAGATVLSAAGGQFDHGLTRNLLAEHAHGEILVFLNKRTRPVDANWLAPLVATLEQDTEVAGACSRVVAPPDADLLLVKDFAHELSASPERQRKRIDDPLAYDRMSPEERRVFLNFHTVSAAIRAEAFQQVPFRSMRTIGEDLLWAKEVLESGWALVHEPASAVYHSHDYTLRELFLRNVDDGVANRDIVGRSLDDEQLLAMIAGAVRDDWRYLHEVAGLHGEELEEWKLRSALRRAAQLAGQWMGVNHEVLPAGAAAHFSRVARTRAGIAPS